MQGTSYSIPGMENIGEQIDECHDQVSCDKIQVDIGCCILNT